MTQYNMVKTQFLRDIFWRPWSQAWWMLCRESLGKSLSWPGLLRRLCSHQRVWRAWPWEGSPGLVWRNSWARDSPVCRALKRDTKMGIKVFNFTQKILTKITSFVYQVFPIENELLNAFYFLFFFLPINNNLYTQMLVKQSTIWRYAKWFAAER